MTVASTCGRCYRRDAMAGEALSQGEIEQLRTSLLGERDALAHQLRELETLSFSTPQSDLTGESAFDEEYADSGTATFERERDLSLEHNVRDLMQKIDRALSRIEAGTFGTCERCGRSIEKARLKALPYANLCIKDARATVRR